MGYQVKSVGQQELAVTMNISGLIMYVSVIDNGGEIYVTYSLSDGAPPTRSVLTYSGELRIEIWSSRSSVWTVVSKWPPTECNL